jgi:outer membrane receptor for ferrienterochelin and colicins
MRTYLLISILVLCVKYGTAQQSMPDSIRGTVQASIGPADEGRTKTLPGAKLQWLGADKIYVSNPLGQFEIPTAASTQQLIISYPGFRTDTIVVDTKAGVLSITLNKSANKLVGLSVTGAKRNTEISYLSTAQVLKIKEGELLKAACCNLSESFETTPSVDVSFTDAITGQKQIQMLGLATPHTLITQENIPNIRGLASTVGLNYTPGSWVQGMQLSKGTGSVTNGFEGLAGQINVELKKPDDEKEQYYLNLYQNTGGRAEANLNAMKKISKNFAAGTLLHYKNQFVATDNNGDNFIDNPRGYQAVAAARAQYFSDNGVEIQGIVRYVSTSEFSYAQSHGSSLHAWNMASDTRRTETALKFGKLYKKKPWKSMGLQLAGFKHEQQLTATSRYYSGEHQNLYANYIFQTIIGNTSHGIKFGGSYIQDITTEDLPAAALPGYGNMSRNEKVPGVFVEHTYNYLEKFNIVSGLRVDRSSMFGTFVTPRVHIRYAPRYGTTLRASVGKARRTVNVLAENLAAYFTKRQFIFEGAANQWIYDSLPEIAWNMGTSITQDFKLNYRKGTAVLDYYYTIFEQQWIADYETPREIHFYANKNNSFAHAMQATIDYEIVRKKLDIRIAYKRYNVSNTYRGIALQKQLQARHRGFVNIAYKTSNHWNFDATASYNGARRLPNYFATSNDTNFSAQYSPSFMTYNAHISKGFSKSFEVYAGGENISNYMQRNAIISAADPSSSDFDAAQVWGPVMGINVYAGLRWKGAWK